MGWTDERVELLKKLWQEGLSGRAAPSQPSRPVYRPQRPARPAAAPAAPRRLVEPAQLAAATPSPARYVDETPGTATVLTLGAHMCKWPIGDPALDNFTFCGRRTGEGPYCHEHAQVAYQPAQAKKKSSAAELARSLRRYL